MESIHARLVRAPCWLARPHINLQFCSMLAYPRCTNPTKEDPDSDCGSVGWAFLLFIAWNLLSMVCCYPQRCSRWLTLLQYIFVNMFTGVVVENFSYVFQLTGGAGSISREEMRAFKKVWAEFANPKTQHLERGKFVAFFAVCLSSMDY